MLVIAAPDKKLHRREDPVMQAFLSFLAQDMVGSPQQVQPLDETLMSRINDLVGRITVDHDEDLGADPLI